MVILVVDGQGGGIGRAVIERLKSEIGPEHEIMAVGINAMATMGMMKGGAKNIATGENAVFLMRREPILLSAV